MITTQQEQFWSGEFGQQYTDRNTEYYNPELTTIPYRGNEGFLWKAITLLCFNNAIHYCA
jgi:hypothetical protein